MKIPFLDLKAQFATIAEDIELAIKEVINHTAFASGPYVEEFERNFAIYHKSDYCIGVNSGTSALHLALIAANIKEGDEIITTPQTFIATTWAISYVGAIPVFADIDPDTYTLDPKEIESKITPKTKAVMPVHLYGQAADLEPIAEICKKHNLILIEDAAQAQGAEYKNKDGVFRKVGNYGLATCFSFYPGKNLGAYGEAGAVITNDEKIAERIKLLRNHAQSQRYYHDELAYNYRMDGIQGAVLNTKLKHLEKWNNARRNVAKIYNEALGKIEGIKIPIEAEYAKHIYHVYQIVLPSTHLRDTLLDYLSKRDIGTGMHYPVPVHLQKAYLDLGYKVGDFPICEKVASTALSLPIYAELSLEMQNYVIENIQNFAKEYM